MEPIFTYTDYRQFLRDKYGDLKAKNAAFSYRYFSQKAGFSSPNFLKLVIDGKRNLSPESIHKFSEAFKLGKKEQRFFELLVHYAQALDPHQKQYYYQQLLEFPTYQKAHHLEKEQYTYLSHWYYPVILEMVSLPFFKEDPEWISAQLGKKISPKEAKDSLDCLLALNLLKRDGAKLVPTHSAMTTGEEARSLAAYSFHEQIFEQAKEALNQQSPDEREFAAITMAISETQLKKIKELMRDFRKLVLNYLSQETSPPNAVYQFSAQLFSLTTISKNKRETKGE
ncbi:MAG: TIGR02147 family protein [Deltaproteobacteria bacterium]|nr:TIGR02147 family protein [Deltaproteobacteria bacterium]